MTGRFKQYEWDKGFGFIKDETGKEYSSPERRVW